MHKGLQQNGVCTKRVTNKVKGLGIMCCEEQLKEIGKFRDVAGVILCSSIGYTLDQQVVNFSSV